MNKTNKQLHQQQQHGYLSSGGTFVAAASTSAIVGTLLTTQTYSLSSAAASSLSSSLSSSSSPLNEIRNKNNNNNNQFVTNADFKYITHNTIMQKTNFQQQQQQLTFAQVAGGIRGANVQQNPISLQNLTNSTSVKLAMNKNGNKVNCGAAVEPQLQQQATLVSSPLPGVATASATPTAAIVPVIVANKNNICNNNVTGGVGGQQLMKNVNNIKSSNSGNVAQVQQQQQQQLAVIQSNNGGSVATAAAKYVITTTNPGVSLNEDIINHIILGTSSASIQSQTRGAQTTVIKPTTTTPTITANTSQQQKPFLNPQTLKSQSQQKLTAVNDKLPLNKGTSNVMLTLTPAIPPPPLAVKTTPTTIAIPIAIAAATKPPLTAPTPDVAKVEPINAISMSQLSSLTHAIQNDVVTVLSTSMPSNSLPTTIACQSTLLKPIAAASNVEKKDNISLSLLEQHGTPSASDITALLPEVTCVPIKTPAKVASCGDPGSPRKRAKSLQDKVYAASTTSERRHSAAVGGIISKTVLTNAPIMFLEQSQTDVSVEPVLSTVEEEEKENVVASNAAIEEKQLTVDAVNGVEEQQHGEEEEEEALILCTPTKYKKNSSENTNGYEQEEYLDSSPEKSLTSIEEDEQGDIDEDGEGEVILPDVVYMNSKHKRKYDEIKGEAPEGDACNKDALIDIKKEIVAIEHQEKEEPKKQKKLDEENDVIILEPETNAKTNVKQEIIDSDTDMKPKLETIDEKTPATLMLQCNEVLQLSNSTNNSLHDSSSETTPCSKSTNLANNSVTIKENKNILPAGFTNIDNAQLSTLRMRHLPKNVPPAKQKTTYSKVMKQPSTAVDANSFGAVYEMISNYNMLKWIERVGKPRGTNLEFQLNEYNLLQIYERCPTRNNVQIAYEKPIYEREPSLQKQSDPFDPLLYLCRRCHCHGPATDFLAPEFCSMDCLKRDTRKRKRSSAHQRSANLNVAQQQHGHGQDTQKSNVAHHHYTHNDVPPQEPAAKRKFRWSTILSTKVGGIAAPIHFFLNPFPISTNPFVEGMKVEAIDPENCSLFCVCTVVKIQGYRLKLHFDGYDKTYDFWVNADSMDIFPPGWCAKTSRVLQPPKHIDPKFFTWSRYTLKTKANLAGRHLFTHLNSAATATVNPFKIGMHLEAEDLNDTGKLCVATVADVIDDRIRIHFDGWDDCYDYWVHISSPYIHPCGWHQGRQQLIVPPDYENVAFDWPEYIRSIGKGCAATEELFCVRDPIDFQPNMKLEVVDPRNPSLIRPASVVTRRGHRIKVHLECWPAEYCFWLEDDSPDLHPMGWCDATGHDLEPPPGFYQRFQDMPCDVRGCRGIGNAKSHLLSTHAMADACPYAPHNWRNKLIKPQRVQAKNILRPPPHCAPFLVVRKEHKNIVATPVQLAERQGQQYEELCCDATTSLDMVNIKPEVVEIDEDQSVDNDVQMKDLNLHVSKQLMAAAAENNNSLLKVQAKQLPALTPPSQPVKPMNAISNSLEIQVSKEFLSDYGPRLQQNYELLQHNFNFKMGEIKTNPLNWSTTKTAGFVQRLLESKVIAHKFLKEDIDGSSLLMLQQSDLTEGLDLKLGPAVKLYTCILQLRTYTMLSFNIKPPIMGSAQKPANK